MSEKFYKLSVEERIKKLKESTNLKAEDFKALESLDINISNNMIENVIGNFTMPMGIATNFIVDGKNYLVPMVTEEASVIAAASNGAKIAGEFKAISTPNITIGQIQLLDIKNYKKAEENIINNKEKILAIANSESKTITKLGGGAKDIKIRQLENMLIVHLLIDTKDAMGANIVNTMCEAVAPILEDLTGARANLKILSNLAMGRLTEVETRVKALNEDVIDGIIEAYEFAVIDPFRSVTHNKGIMNGIIALTLATGNDTRAVESAAHGYAAIDGIYKPLTHWEKSEEYLIGRIKIPIPIGIVGGATKILPGAKLAMKLLDITNVNELASLMGAVGLAQNLAALKALSTEGIQRGHMKLHAKNIAITAGAKTDEVNLLVEKLIQSGEIKVQNAKNILKDMRN